MPIRFTCPCGKTLQVPDEFAGQKGKCPACKGEVLIPGPAKASDEGGHITAEAPPAAPAKPKPPPLPRAYDEPPPPKVVKSAEALEDDDDEELAPVTNHAGTPLTDDEDYFADAPKKLGRVVTSASTLRTSKEPLNPALRLAIIFFSTGLLMVVGLAIAFFLTGLNAGLVLWPLGLGGLAAVLAWYLTIFRHSCTYVGERGIAWFECSGSRDHLKRADIFLFRDAAELRISQTRHYYNGVYTGTNYSFTWSDENGKQVYLLSGNYRSEKGTPKESDPYYFAQSAEIAWTQYLFRNIDQVLSAGGKFLFGLKGSSYVELGEGFLVLDQGSGPMRLDADQIDRVAIENGVVSIWEVGGKKGWFSSTGVHSFAYGDLGNARFFLIALEKLLGIRL